MHSLLHDTIFEDGRTTRATIALGIIDAMWLDVEQFCRLTIETAERKGQVPEDELDR